MGNSKAPTRSRAGSAGRAGAQAGYVLVEVLATLVITLMLLAFAFPGVPAGTTPTRLKALFAATVALLRDARSDAISAGASASLIFDAPSRSLRLGARRLVLPADVTILIDAGGHCGADAAQTRIVFRADGTNCGGVIRLSKGPLVLRARLDWIDGRIDVPSGS